MQDSVYGPDHDEVGKIAARAPKRKAAEPERASAAAASRDWKVLTTYLTLPMHFLASWLLHVYREHWKPADPVLQHMLHMHQLQVESFYSRTA